MTTDTLTDAKRDASAPDDLGKSGIELWNSITDDYELRRDELEVLHAACRIRDQIDKLTEGIAGQPLTVLGSQKNLVIHPLISERRYQEQALAGLLGKIKFHDSVETVTTTVITDGPMSRSESGRKAARARWDRAKGLTNGDV
ncbi:hypothetical protein [Pseudonocardia hydrocarbonoxydans]|uniref:Terminase small subunit n=1 Tax=Pseudonocardia hydrocarbonoxydans TaxID=76726 RepID=A0A4Y3WUJ2_9PSEU|nr:hypothetical protein [Pseudonocardia hydrocarbonoxydans]GEC22208.1 hypothetical protein PHY01_44910 [Pseudonocardia hydrocarbonoxydans]